jgi:hypothetical protein
MIDLTTTLEAQRRDDTIEATAAAATRPAMRRRRFAPHHDFIENAAMAREMYRL